MTSVCDGLASSRSNRLASGSELDLLTLELLLALVQIQRQHPNLPHISCKSSAGDWDLNLLAKSLNFSFQLFDLHRVGPSIEELVRIQDPRGVQHSSIQRGGRRRQAHHLSCTIFPDESYVVSEATDCSLTPLV